MPVEFVGKSQPLTAQGFAAALQSLSVEPKDIWTLLAVETCGCGFLPDRRSQIRYERHIFHRLTGGRFDDGDISDPAPGGYGPEGAHQYDRLNRAIALDRNAALSSASWGLGQIMGENAKLAGFADADSMAAAMSDSEDAQLEAVCAFLKSTQLDAPLRSRQWSKFASGYNGSSAVAKYSACLEEQFAKYSSGALPNLDTRAAQMLLLFNGYEIEVDGIAGPGTKTAVLAFQRRNNLAQTGTVDSTLLSSLTRNFGAPEPIPA